MNKFNKKSKGFTLTELMIVLCIIGTLSALALPSYLNYLTRTQTTRVYSEISALKLDIDICLSQNKTDASSCRLKHSGSSLLKSAPDGSLGTPMSRSLSSTGFPSVKWAETISGQTDTVQVIKGVFGNAANANIDGNTISLIRLPSGEWRCETSLQKKYAPSGCHVRGN